MPEFDLDNEFTGMAESLWKMYSQLIRSGFEHPAAMELTKALLTQLVASVQHGGQAQ